MFYKAFLKAKHKQSHSGARLQAWAKKYWSIKCMHTKVWKTKTSQPWWFSELAQNPCSLPLPWPSALVIGEIWCKALIYSKAVESGRYIRGPTAAQQHKARLDAHELRPLRLARLLLFAICRVCLARWEYSALCVSRWAPTWQSGCAPRPDNRGP